ncbi:MAG: hypothetical protein IJM64_01225 [Ottowia sp.]|nr:hypothetical protein [Ottowia sp.]
MPPSNIVPPATAPTPARKAVRRPPARRTAPAEPPAIEAALGAPIERPAAPRKTAARKQSPSARRAKDGSSGNTPAVHTTINPNYAWPFADVQRA